MWGQVEGKFTIVLKTGIIPTRVGTRTSPDVADISIRDHPHACGDKSITVADIVPYTGSSPRVWGQGRSPIPVTQVQAIIPTRVGTRGLSKLSDETDWDHPHACGDK